MSSPILSVKIILNTPLEKAGVMSFISPAPCIDGGDIVIAEEQPLTDANTVAIPSTTSSTLFLASNPDRRKIIIFNQSTAVLYVLLEAAGATTSFYTVAIGPSSSYEFSFAYVGPVSGVWQSVNGQALVTEVVL